MKDHIDPGNLPKHIAVIMDGNGRWAKQQGAARVFGHRSAIKAVREVTEGCAEIGIKYLTLYAFSTENWNRPKFEVDALMTLLVHTIRGEIKTLMDNNVRLATIGHTESLPSDCQRELQEAMRATEGNTGLTLILALSYSGRWEILEAVRQLTADIQRGQFQPSDINEGLFSSYLTTGGVPDPELMIRTSGEMRISNFMLWQLAYSEFYMPDVLW
ncbi:MAG TPA: isoprenyl transferase, partial [Fibrella sp.]